jgi:exonuclease III
VSFGYLLFFVGTHAAHPSMRKIISHICVCLLPLSFLACTAEIDSQRAPDEEETASLVPVNVRVATWNIETIGARGTAEYNAELAILKRLNVDVIGFNEVDGAVDLTNFANLAQDAGYPFTAIAGASPFGSDRNAFYSKLPIISQVTYTSALLSGDPNANDQSRFPLEITVDVPGTQLDLTLISQHWKSGFEDSDEFRKATESYRIRQQLASRSKQNDAYIVMGDMNYERGDSTFPAAFSVVPPGMPTSFVVGSDIKALLTSTSGFKNNPVSWLEDPNGPSLAVIPQRQKDGSEATRPSSGRHIDYIFMSPLLIAQSPKAEIYDSTDETLAGGLPKNGAALASNTSGIASDHFPVFMDLKLPANNTRAMLFSFKDSENFAGLSVNNEDIVSLRSSDNKASLYFDGSDLGLGSLAIDGLAVLPTGEILLSFDEPGNVPGLSTIVDDSDIVLFHPDSLGEDTRGEFSLYFDGSDVGLSTDDEDIDAIALTPTGDLLLSTLGNATMSGFTVGDEDLFVFKSSSLGPTTAGSYSLFFDGEDKGLTTTGEDIDAVAFNTDGSLFLSTTGDFSVAGANGDDEDIFLFQPTTSTFSIHSRLVDLGASKDSDIGSLEFTQ